jgi:hypothetical protein
MDYRNDGKLGISLFHSKYPPAKPGSLRLLAPQRGLTAIGQIKNRSLFGFVAVAVIPAKAGIQCFFWIPGRVSLAWNDDPTPGTVKLWESPGRAGGLPKF